MEELRYLRIILIVAFLILILPLDTLATNNSKWHWDDTAEINARIDGEIPSIKLTKWTSINITIVDDFFLNWDEIRRIRPEWYLKLFWPLNPFLPQPIQRFLGYTSLKLEAEIIDGNPRGWHVKVDPTTIVKTNTGMVHRVILYVQTDDSAINSSVIAAIKCTRRDALGGELGTTYIYVPVKAAPTNFIEMKTVGSTTKYAGLKTMVYFTLDVINEGYYKDVFQFEIEAENGLLGLFNEQAVVIKPGETKRVTLGILTPEKLFDTGTANKVEVYVKSSGNETKTLIGTLTVITQGFYITPLVFIVAGFIFFIFLIAISIYMLYRETKEKEFYGRPTKPWLIPVEREYLKELKEKDREKYRRTLKMMKEEYQSALLWYKDYIKSKNLEKLKSKSQETKETTEDLEESKESLDKGEEGLEKTESKKSFRFIPSFKKSEEDEGESVVKENSDENSSSEGSSLLSKLFGRSKDRMIEKEPFSKEDREDILEEIPPEINQKASDSSQEPLNKSSKIRKRNHLMQKIVRQQRKQRKNMEK